MMPLQARGLLKIYLNLYSFRSASSNLKAFEFGRKARFLGKLLAENATERKQWSKGLPTHKVYGATCLSPKRLEVLNRIFLANITDGLTTSSRCDQLADLGLLISRAELSKCGQSLKVMWTTCSADFDEEAARLLEECKDELRDNIVTKSVGGYIPHIIFSKDLDATNSRDIYHILEQPSVKKYLDIVLPTEEGVGDQEEEEERFNVKLSTDILGLKRDAVLKRVMVTAMRLRKTDREKESEGIVYEENDEDSSTRLANIDARKQKLAIGEFIKQRTKLDRKYFKDALATTRIRVNEFDDQIEDDEDEWEHEDNNEEEYDDGFSNMENSFDETRLESNEKRPTT